MSVMPNKVVDRIQYSEDHIAPFSSNAVAIGTTTSAVTDLQTKTVAARSAYSAAQAARNAAKAATNDLKIAAAVMTDALADIIRQIKSQAAISGAGVYSLAEVDPPAPPSPLGPLGKPSDFVVRLEETGAINLKWKCTNPRSAGGTIYQVFRRIGGSGEFTYLGGTGEKRFTDMTLPFGSTQVTYQLQAVRSTAVGPWAQFNVNFGVGSGGAMTASVTESAPAKIAA